MTVRVVLLNCGNHPDDEIRLKDGRTLKHGEHADIRSNHPVEYEVVKHGSGAACLQHVPVAIPLRAVKKARKESE